MKIERQVATNEADFASIDVILFEVGVIAALKAFTERTLIIHKLDERDRSVGPSNRIPASTDAHFHLLGSGWGGNRLRRHRCGELGLLLLEQLSNLPQLANDGISLVPTDCSSRSLWRRSNEALSLPSANLAELSLYGPATVSR